MVKARAHAIGTTADPVLLEVFNNLFMAIAEQMGVTLANTAYSVNIKERLDFSCAIFDGDGNLIANAPHMPVHLGSMGESVKTIIERRAGTMKRGDVFVLNAPYNGGTHLPDVTVIAPVFLAPGLGAGPARAAAGGPAGPEFYVASRGHHADIGGITPGSMPPDSTHVDEEGVLLDNVQLVAEGRFLEDEMRAILASGRYPSRNIDQNLADLRAQVASTAKGIDELGKMVAHFGLPVVRAYMQHVQDNAEEAVRRVLDALSDGHFAYEMDSGAVIKVAIAVDRVRREATIDFTGTSAQQPTNFNAPSAVCKAAVLYVFRTLVDDDIPMNAGCLKPLRIIIPEGSMLCPRYPAAVVAGNVETSQTITDALYGALGVLAASQGTMNNFTFGNDQYQYYETIAGGAGAGPDFDGASVVQTHMTNSRLTDPEVLEWRFPVRLEAFTIRRGSGGRGRHLGGDGCVRRVRFLEEMTAVMLANHRRVRAVRRGRRGSGVAGPQLGRACRWHEGRFRRNVRGAHASRRRLRDRNPGRRRIRKSGPMSGPFSGRTVGIDWLVAGARPEAPLAERVAWIEQLLVWIRARGGADAEGAAAPATRLKFFLQVLDRHPDHKTAVALLLRATLRELDAVGLLCETGLPRAHAFFQELTRRITAKLIPAPPAANDMAALFRRLFPTDADADWVAALPSAALDGLGELLRAR